MVDEKLTTDIYETYSHANLFFTIGTQGPKIAQRAHRLHRVHNFLQPCKKLNFTTGTQCPMIAQRAHRLHRVHNLANIAQRFGRCVYLPGQWRLTVLPSIDLTVIHHIAISVSTVGCAWTELDQDILQYTRLDLKLHGLLASHSKISAICCYMPAYRR